MDPQAVEAVDLLNANYGSHEATRAVHAKGTLCKGRFTPTAVAAQFTRAAHMQQPVDVTARFSNASGDPATRDALPDGRGLAVKFYLPDGSRTDIVSVTLPAFIARTPEDFLQLNRALKRDERRRLPKPRPARLLAYLVTHWSARHALLHALRAKPVPSYANCRYEALHAFKWVDGAGAERYVRYRWIPHAGEATLESGEAKGRDRDFLQHEIVERLEREPVRFTLELQLAEPGDPVDDSTAIWPQSRRRVDGDRARADRDRRLARAGRRRAGLRPDAADGRDRGFGGPDPQLPPARLLRVGRAPNVLAFGYSAAGPFSSCSAARARPLAASAMNLRRPRRAIRPVPG